MEVNEVKRILESKIKYSISMEISGEMGMWARNDTGSEKGTYPIPTFSALKGVFESILYIPSVLVIPYKIQICSPIKYQPYTFNYRGELRKPGLIKSGNTCQIRTTILYKPCYRCYAYVVNNDKEINSVPNKYKGVNHAHSYQGQFNRRLIKGKNYRTPCLGLSEFLVSYVGKFREKTKVQENINYTLSSMVFCCFDSLNNGAINPSYIQNVEIIKGEVEYVK